MKILFLTLFVSLIMSFSAMAKPFTYKLYNKHHKVAFVLTFAEVVGSKEIHYVFKRPSKSVVTLTDKMKRKQRYSCEALTVVDEIFTRVNKITCSNHNETLLIETQNIVDYNRDDLSVTVNGQWFYVW